MPTVDVRVLSEAFLGLNEGDATVQRLKVILVLPRCSSSALNDPVPAIHSEHGGTSTSGKENKFSDNEMWVMTSRESAEFAD